MPFNENDQMRFNERRKKKIKLIKRNPAVGEEMVKLQHNHKI